MAVDVCLRPGLASVAAHGGRGDDAELVGRAGVDSIYGGPGNDVIEGGEGGDFIYGQGGDDLIEGGGGNDLIYGDHYWQDLGADSGDDGDDIISGGLSSLPGQQDDDSIYGGGGDDRIDGWEGNDLIYGDYDRYDPLHQYYPERGVFAALVGAGNDEIYGWGGDDYICGGPGHDDLFGEGGNNNVYGGWEGVPFAGEDLQHPDKDWIYPPDSETKYPRVDLVADVDRDLGWEGAFYSDDNREENGFYGGLILYDGVPRVQIEINVHSNGINLVGETLRLGNYDTSLIQVYDSQTGGNVIDPNYAWTIDDPDMSLVVWVQVLDFGYGSLTLSVDGFADDRPVLDFLFFQTLAEEP